MKPRTAVAVMIAAAVAFGLLFALILEVTTPTPALGQIERERLRKLSELWDEHQKAEQRAFQARLEGRESTITTEQGKEGLNYFLPEKMRLASESKPSTTSSSASPPRAEDKAYCQHFEQLPKKYLSFEPWPGGWNNRRLSLECLLVLSLISGRTLILPAYNFNIPDEHIAGAIMLSYDTAYDMDLLKQYFNVVTMDEFVRCGSESVLKGLAYRPTSCDKTYEGTKDRFFCESSKLVSSRAKFAQFDGGTFFQIPHDWNTRDPKGHGRRPTGFPDEHLGATILHYQRNVLSCFSNMLYIRPDVKATERVAPNMPSPFADPNSRLKLVSPNETMRHAVFGRIRDGLKYNKDIRTLAAKIVEELGGVDQFSCVHLRRKDFKIQYPDTVGDPPQVLYNLRSLLKPGERILLSTDDEHEVVESLTKNATATGLNIQWKVWSQLTTKMFDVNRIQIPLVCQEVCVSARLFAPNPHSTYSGLVVRRRGYRGALGAYYTTVRIDAASNPRSVEPDNLPDEAGPTWGHETRHGWMDLD